MPLQARLDFLGAAGTVTGSRHLLTCGKHRVLVDCGLFQGRRELKALNWSPFAVEPASIDAVIFTHGHIDHIGYLPRLVKEGFHGPVYCTPATGAVCAISLPDSAHLQEEEARFANKRGYTDHRPALPLYTIEDAHHAMKLIRRREYYTWHELAEGLVFRFHCAGHILGSAFVEIAMPSGETVLFGGDLGRNGTPIINDPDVIEYADYLVQESTYGDRVHPKDVDVAQTLAEVVRRTADREGVLLIPAFAIGRAQQVLYLLHGLRERGELPELPIYLDSPMAAAATRLHTDFVEEHDKEMALLMSVGNPLAGPGVRVVTTQQQSQKLNTTRGPMVIISSSGMCNGGRIVHHLLHRLEDERNTVLFVGFQAEGTLGRRLVDGEQWVRIYGEEVNVKAEIVRIDALSAHADSDEIMEWLSRFKKPPKMTFVVHGEPPAANALRQRMRDTLGWPCCVPYNGDHFTLV
ncbi:MAG: MBL fold metallo-hydrolase [Fimbriimonadia bacterium]|jgi:metallo-beta-lactamase family protein